MPRPGFGRVATRFIAAVATIAALAGCGTPSNLDHQEQVAFARACASLVERGLSDDRPPRQATLDGKTLNLDEPADFYSQLEQLRGQSTFNLHDPQHAADTARQPLDNCETKPKVLSALFPGSGTATTTTETTTTTTVPGT